jgi:PAS domain S-box-containing protein
MSDLKKRILLLVEDEPIIALSQKATLEKYGYKVFTANSGEKAIILSGENHNIELILMDIDLGEGIDGTETARRILNVHTIPIVFLSSHTEPQIVEKTEQITSYGYVVKNSGITVLDASIKMAFKLFDAHCSLQSQNMEIEAVYEEMQAANEELETTNEELIQSQNDLVEHAKVLHESERKYRDIYNNAIEGIFQTTPEGRLTGANPAYAATFGFESPESILKEVNDIGYQLYAHPEDRERLKVLMSEQSRVVNFEVEARTRKGEVIWVSINASELLDDNGALKYITGTTIDITERKLAVELLRESENRYNQLAEQNLTFAWEVDNKGMYTYASHISELILGYRPEELVGIKYFYDLCPEDERESLKSEVFAAFERHESFVGLENLMLSKDGRIVRVSSNAIPLFNSDGSLRGYRGLDTDISERIKTKHALEESELRYRTLIENSGQAIVVARNEMIIYANPITSVILGYSLDEIHSRPFIEFIYHEDREMVMEHHVKRLAGEIDSKSLYIFRSLTKEGKIQWFEINAVIIEWDGRTATLNFLTDINERKQAEEIQQRLYDDLAATIKAIPDLMFEVDRKGRIFDCRCSNFNDLYVEPEVFLGKRVDEILPYDVAGIIQQGIDDAALNGIHSGSVYPLSIKGVVKWFELSISAKGEYLNNHNRFIVLARNITERKQAEDALIESELFTNRLMEYIPVPVFYKNINGLYQGFNNAYEDFFGVRKEELLGKSVFEINPEELARVYHEKDTELFNKGGTQVYESHVMNRKGEIRDVIFHKAAIADIKGNITGIVGVILDITERNVFVDLLRESEERYRQLFNHSPLGIYIADRDGNILDANERLLNILGSPSLDATKNINVFKLPVLAENGYTDKFRECFDKNTIVTLELIYTSQWGKIIYLSNYIVPIVDAAGKVIKVFTLMEDISKRKQAEEKIQDLLFEKDIILKEVHHRMKNYMNTIKGLLVLQSESINDQLAKTALFDAQNRVQSMMLLYDKLYQSDDFKEISVLNYLPDLVSEIIDNFPNRKSVKIIKNIDDFVLDAKKLQSIGIIINELLTNIMKYAFPGRDDGLITVSASHADKQVLIVIQDNGNGIPESVSFHNSRGFGMQLVGMLTEQIGGSIRIERGTGTKFLLEFNV